MPKPAFRCLAFGCRRRAPPGLPLPLRCRRRPRKATFKAKKCRKPLPAFFCRGYELESLSSSRTGGATPKTFMVNLFYSMLENFHLQLCVLLCTVG